MSALKGPVVPVVTSRFVDGTEFVDVIGIPVSSVSRQRAVSVDFTLSTIGKVAVTVGNNADGVRPEAINPEPLNQEIPVDIKFTVDRKDGDPVLAVNLPDADVTKTVASYSVFI